MLVHVDTIVDFFAPNVMVLFSDFSCVSACMFVCIAVLDSRRQLGKINVLLHVIVTSTSNNSFQPPTLSHPITLSAWDYQAEYLQALNPLKTVESVELVNSVEYV